MSSSEHSSTGKRESGWPRALILGLVVAALLAAFLMRPPAAAGAPTLMAGVPVLGSCGFKEITTIPCPGCGLTRSWVVAAHGSLATSIAYHRLGFPLMLYAVIQAIRQLVWLVWPSFRGSLERGARHFDRFGFVLLALMMINWVAMVVGLVPRSLAFTGSWF